MKRTVESIMKSFQNSGKRHLVLTGNLRSGKTTRFREIVKMFTKDDEEYSLIKKQLMKDYGIISDILARSDRAP